MGTIGENIKEARLKSKMTQEQLAKAIETTKAAVSRYESDKRDPSWDILKKIAVALNADPVYLLYGFTADEFQQQVSREIEAEEQEWQERLLPGNAVDLVSAFLKLNEEGKLKAIERVEELTEIPKYLACDKG